MEITRFRQSTCCGKIIIVICIPYFWNIIHIGDISNLMHNMLTFIIYIISFLFIQHSFYKNNSNNNNIFILLFIIIIILILYNNNDFIK